MKGFCVECGTPHDDQRTCPNCGHVPRKAGSTSGPLAPSTEQGIGPLPKASTAKRLLGSGAEYGIYVTVLGILAVISTITAGIFDMLLVPILLLMIGFRDVNAGLFSIAKRIGRMRVVEYGTGKPATNGQALLRNSYYMALTFLMIFPIILTDIAATMFFMLLVVIDVILISLSKEGRRIGDWLAETQVVQEARGA